MSHKGVVAHAAYGIGGQLQTRRPMRGRLLPLRGQADDVDVQPQLSGETVNQRRFPTAGGD